MQNAPRALPLLVTDTVFEQHETGRHPECPARLRAVRAKLQETGWIERLPGLAPQVATLKQLTAVHAPEHVERVRLWAERGGGQVESDTVMSSKSFEVATLAAGAVIAAVDAVMTGKHRRALCLIRPPGHHALADSIMGFCLFNNIAIAAAHALKQHTLSRVLVVDWDVHHGNGTQDIFYESERVHFLSVHRWPFYPGTGAADEIGAGPGMGATWNLPLEMGTARRDVIGKFSRLLEDAAAKCRPDLILLSAGFDAHRADPIGSLGLETEDFQTLTKSVIELANTHCEGRLVSVLEGGYHLDALAESVECHLRTLAETK